MIFRHWDEFYQRGDLEALYQSGISHLRVPVGYWLVDVAEDFRLIRFKKTNKSVSSVNNVVVLVGWCQKLSKMTSCE